MPRQVRPPVVHPRQERVTLRTVEEPTINSKKGFFISTTRKTRRTVTPTTVRGWNEINRLLLNSSLQLGQMRQGTGASGNT